MFEEYTFSRNGCTEDTIADVITNSDYREVEGDFSIFQGVLEAENYITEILEDRFRGNDMFNHEAVKSRAMN